MRLVRQRGKAEGAIRGVHTWVLGSAGRHEPLGWLVAPNDRVLEEGRGFQSMQHVAGSWIFFFLV